MGKHVFKLPDVGEGVVEGEIVKWNVKPGDTVKEDEPLVEIMTDKATVAIPSTVNGKVVSTTGKPGDMIPVGAELIVFEVDGEGSPEPEPEPEPEQPRQQEQPQPEPAPEPTREAQVEQARERAEASGISQIRDAFADLRTEESTAALTNPQALVTAAPTAAGGARRSGSGSSASELLSSASSGSSGIDTSQIARDGGGTGLESRQTTRVQGPAAGGGGGGGAPARGSDGSAPGKGRPIDEIQIVFDRTKGAFYSIYNRARRSNPTLSGKVVVRLTIAPSGAVSAVEILESQLDDADLESKILNRIRLMNFGAKSVPPITLDYPLFFEPG